MSVLSLEEKMTRGSRRQIRPGDKDQAEVWVCISELLPKEGTPSSFSPNTFYLKGLVARSQIEIIGRTALIVKEIGQEAALKLLDKVGVGSLKRKNSELDGVVLPLNPKPKVTSNLESLIEVKEKHIDHGQERVCIGTGSWDTGCDSKVFDIFATVDLRREEGEEVKIKVHHLDAMVGDSKVVVRSDGLQRSIEVMLRMLAAEVFMFQA